MTTKTRHDVASLEELREKGRLIVQVGKAEIGLFEVDGEVRAWRNLCPHAFAPVCEGRVCGTRLASNVYEYVYGRDQEILRCPWHGWEFDLKTGQHLAGEQKLRGYKAEVEEGRVYIEM
ncbi:Rieske (2Fe-2S) protein [Paenibacillus sp. IB182496]|uniref:Rieske (2Fe-2S) protein n=1 Tax=Paenibacillus sabuli TaxID=2772509 RepID=A0A927GUM5_9BACL|nr:Rieske (2Fe-2S) protein [Paenibacillus sabuli]MBD2847862.1 Rieske (2Fe-2S) protein [Paenibacillus sabuli]